MTEYIGRYRTERIVGSGAFATVWLALDETLQAWIALKVLAENWARDSEIRNRFLEEARIMWRADSDHIVRIHNVDVLDDGRPYFVMDYADRGSLALRMTQRAEAGYGWGVDEVRSIGADMCRGLEVAHSLGVVHRDLKPANVLFQTEPEHRGEREERLLLTDFGVARSLATSRGTTIATGTPHYMAPEQADGQADERSDIYSAGVVLYQLLAGRVPYEHGSLRQLLLAHHTETPPRIETLRNDIPPALADTVHRALSIDPDERIASAAALRTALEGDQSVPPVTSGDAMNTVGPATFAAVGASQAAPAAAAAVGTPPGDSTGGPPTDGPPPTAATGDGGGGRRRGWWKVVVPLVLVLGGLGAALAIIVSSGDDEGDGPEITELVAEPIASVGLDPFFPSLVPSLPDLASLDLPEPGDIELPTGLIDELGGSVEPADIGDLAEEVLEGLNPGIGLPTGIDLPTLDIPTVDAPPSGAASGPTISGAAPGLYGGTNVIDVCNRGQLVEFLAENADKAAAWAAAQGITVDQIPSFVDSLTDVILQVDTRVTNHGFSGGVANAIDSVLQAGTAVLVDDFGVPRVRCFCGNPLLPARGEIPADIGVIGDTWDGFDAATAVVIAAVDEIPEFVLDDVLSNVVIFRPPGADAVDSTLIPTVLGPSGEIVTAVLITPGAVVNSLGAGETFSTESVEVSLDPSELVWLAISRAEGLVDTETGVGGRDSPDGFPDIDFAGVDDRIVVTVTAPSGAARTVELDANDAFAAATGNQAVLYGTYPSVRVVTNTDFDADPAVPTFSLVRETGELTSFLDDEGPGTYTFEFSFINDFTTVGATPRLSMLIGTAGTGGPTTTPPPTPNPTASPTTTDTPAIPTPTADIVLGEGDVQVTLRWTGDADLDLYVTDPTGAEISYSNTPVDSGGQLDVDTIPGCGVGAGGQVENVFWPLGAAPPGSYSAYVDVFSDCGNSDIPFSLEIRVDGEVVASTGGSLGGGQQQSETIAAEVS
ncbi:MAG: DUF6777-containing protein [Acidimicrobiales bacterium]